MDDSEEDLTTQEIQKADKLKTVIKTNTNEVKVINRPIC